MCRSGQKCPVLEVIPRVWRAVTALHPGLPVWDPRSRPRPAYGPRSPGTQGCPAVLGIQHPNQGNPLSGQMVPVWERTQWYTTWWVAWRPPTYSPGSGHPRAQGRKGTPVASSLWPGWRRPGLRYVTCGAPRLRPTYSVGLHLVRSSFLATATGVPLLLAVVYRASEAIIHHVVYWVPEAKDTPRGVLGTGGQRYTTWCTVSGTGSNTTWCTVSGTVNTPRGVRRAVPIYTTWCTACSTHIHHVVYCVLYTPRGVLCPVSI